MKFEPIHDLVLVEFEKPVEKIGSILLAEAEKTNIAKVIAVGPGYQDGPAFISTSVKVGQRVLIDKAAYMNEVTIDGKKLVVVRERQSVLGIVE